MASQAGSALIGPASSAGGSVLRPAVATSIARPPPAGRERKRNSAAAPFSSRWVPPLDGIDPPPRRSLWGELASEKEPASVSQRQIGGPEVAVRRVRSQEAYLHLR